MRNSVLCKQQFKKCKTNKTTDASVDAESFSKAVADKVEVVRTSTTQQPMHHIRNSMALVTVVMAVVTGPIKKAANKNSMLDPIPTWIVKQYFDIGLLAPEKDKK